MKWILCRKVGTTLADQDGNVFSLNPSSLQPPYGPYYFTKMPAGTNGDYEQCAVNGSSVVFNPTKHEAVVYGFQLSVPGGFSAISQEPLA